MSGMQGVTQQQLEDELQMSAEDILQTSNTLLQRNLIDMFSGGESNQLVFKLKDADQAMKWGPCTVYPAAVIIRLAW